MQFMFRLTRVPYASPALSRRTVFAQFFVETTCPPIGFAKEVANAVIIQAEQNQVSIGYTPNGDQFVTRIEHSEQVLDFEGDIPRYLRRFPTADNDSFHVSFRLATEDDRASSVVAIAKFIPTYVLTFSLVPDNLKDAGEFHDADFWKQLAGNLFTRISTDGIDGRPADLNVKITVVYGNRHTYNIIEG